MEYNSFFFFLNMEYNYISSFVLDNLNNTEDFGDAALSGLQAVGGSHLHATRRRVVFGV